MSSITQAQTRTRRIGWVVAVLLVLGLIAVFADIWPLGADWLHSYYPVAHDWLHGETGLYSEDSLREFYNMPWMLIILLPLALLPVATAQAVVVVGSILAILAAIHLFRQVYPVPAWTAFMALATMHTVDLLIRGQIDAVLLVGTILGWWAVRHHRPLWVSLAFALLATKPQNVMLVSILFVIEMRAWPRADWLKAASLPLVMLALSPLLAGWDWPLRYLEFVREHPPADHRSISIWRNAPLIGLPIWPFVPVALLALLGWLRAAWRDGLTGWTFCLALTTNLVFGFYVNGYHFILLIPAFVFVASKNRWIALAAYLATWTPLIRLHDNTIMYPDIVYPVILLVTLWLIEWPHRTAHAAPSDPDRSAPQKAG